MHEGLVVVINLLSILVGRQKSCQQLVRRVFRGFRTDKAQALDYAVMVAVDGHGRNAQGAEKQGGRAGSRPHATNAFQPGARLSHRNFGQKIEGVRCIGAAVLVDFAQHCLNERSLLLGLSAGPDGVLHGRGGRGAHGFPSGQHGAQLLVGAVRVGVFGAVREQSTH